MLPENLEAIVIKGKLFLGDPTHNTWDFDFDRDVRRADKFFRSGDYGDALEVYETTFDRGGVLPGSRIFSPEGSCSIVDCYGLISLREANAGAIGRALMNGRSEIKVVSSYAGALRRYYEAVNHDSSLIANINAASERMVIAHLRLAGHYFRVRTRKGPLKNLEGNHFKAIDTIGKGVEILNALLQGKLADDFLLYRASETLVQLADKLERVSISNDEVLDYRVNLYETALNYIMNTKTDDFAVIGKREFISGLVERLEAANAARYSDMALAYNL